MNIEGYEFSDAETLHEYVFHSIGPNGRIKKVVQFTARTTLKGKLFYNLGFGDWNPKTQLIEDFPLSKNRDTLRVLKTIASIVLHFTAQHPEAFIFIKGSTTARTLYGLINDAEWSNLPQCIIIALFWSGENKCVTFSHVPRKNKKK